MYLVIAIHPDGKTLTSSSWNGEIHFWDIATGKLEKTLKGHSDTVLSVAYSSNGEMLASGSRDRTIKVVEHQYKEHSQKHLQVIQNQSGRWYSVPMEKHLQVSVT